MKTINHVHNHMYTLLDKLDGLCELYDEIRRNIKAQYNVIRIDQDEEYWNIVFYNGCAGIKWHDIDGYEVEYISDDLDENILTAYVNEEIKRYATFEQEVIKYLESFGYDTDIEYEDYMTQFNIYYDNVAARFILCGGFEIDEDAFDYIYTEKYTRWNIEREEMLEEYRKRRHNIKISDVV